MPRIPRMLITDEIAVYHVMSRTALPGLPLTDEDKEFFLNQLKFLTGVYFIDVISFCIMDNHFHLLIQTNPENNINDVDVEKSFKNYYKETSKLYRGQIPSFKRKWCNLSEFIKELKQRFTRYYNKKNNRKGYFWADRFKSVIVERGETLVNCSAYIDLNPIRAGIVKKPEEYRWSSIGYYAGTGNKDNFLKHDFGIDDGNVKNEEKFEIYREYVYEVGMIERRKGAVLNEELVKAERNKGYKITITERMRYRTRYFTEGVFIGSKEFVKEQFSRFKKILRIERERKPVRIKGFTGIYSFRFIEWDEIDLILFFEDFRLFVKVNKWQANYWNF